MSTLFSFILQHKSIITRNIIGVVGFKPVENLGRIAPYPAAATAFRRYNVPNPLLLSTTDAAGPRVTSSSTPTATAPTLGSSTAMATSSSSTSNGIIMVLAPAKTMDLRPLSERDFGADEGVDAATISKINAKYDTGQCDAGKTNTICSEMKGKTQGELKALLVLSPNLARTAIGFWSDFSLTPATTTAAAYQPAMYTFAGPAFKGLLSPRSCDERTLSYLASRLFILDPVYGILRSLQDMQAYRLEMGCRLSLADPEAAVNKRWKERRKETLASYWKGSVTSYLGEELRKGAAAPPSPGILVNLASEEYSSSIHIHALPWNSVFLTVVFRHGGRVLSVHAKRARGLMARYLAERGATTLEDIAEFDREGYRCVPFPDGRTCETLEGISEKVSVLRMVFDREGAPSKASTDNGKKRAASKKGTRSGTSKKTKK